MSRSLRPTGQWQAHAKRSSVSIVNPDSADGAARSTPSRRAGWQWYRSGPLLNCSPFRSQPLRRGSVPRHPRSSSNLCPPQRSFQLPLWEACMRPGLRALRAYTCYLINNGAWLIPAASTPRPPGVSASPRVSNRIVGLGRGIVVPVPAV